MPLSSCSPRSSNVRPEPATRSCVVELTSTSPGTGERRDSRGRRERRSRAACLPVAVRPRPCARRRGRRARAPGAPRRSRARSGSLGQARRTRRGSRPRRCRAPRPQKRSSSRRTAAWCSSRSAAQRASPSSRTRSVEPTRSVKRTVVSTRSDGGTGRAPGEELLDLVEDLVGIDDRHVVVALELDEASARDPIGDVAPLLDAASRDRRCGGARASGTARYRQQRRGRRPSSS